jgi:hypothetical protein
MGAPFDISGTTAARPAVCDSTEVRADESDVRLERYATGERVVGSLSAGNRFRKSPRRNEEKPAHRALLVFATAIS